MNRKYIWYILDAYSKLGGKWMGKKELTEKIKEQAENIAGAILKGRDVEIRKSASGISVAEISKKVVVRWKR